MQVIVKLAFLFLLGCAHVGVPVGADSELEGLKTLAKMPGATPATRVALAQAFLASDRHEEGLGYFEPDDDPIGLALQGLFMAQGASDVPLVRRIRWVKDALARLDQAAATDHPVARLFRGVVSAAVPPLFDRAEIAVAELEWVLAHPNAFPVSVERGAHYGLAQAYATLGRKDASARALRRSGHDAIDPSTPVFFGDATWTHANGFRFSSPPSIDEVAPSVFVASGYDFAEQIFFVTDEGVVAIDACSSPENARAALAALRTKTSAPLTHVLLTHAHEDHVGGLSAYATEGVQVVARAGFDQVAGGLNHVPGVQLFWPGGWGTSPPRPTRVVRERERMQIGGRAFDLIPASSGETEDAMFILDVRSSTLVVGDALMPYLGAPFVSEGSPVGMVGAIRMIRELAPKHLLHGHAPLTDLFNLEALPGLERGLVALGRDVEAQIAAGRSEAQVIAMNIVPDALREEPEAALPFVVVRNHFIQRTFRQQQGYWGGEGTGLAPQTRDAWAGAVDLVGGGKARAFEGAVATLLERGDLDLALAVADLGLRRHPRRKRLQELRTTALGRLRLKNHAINPFKFILYSAMSGEELPAL